MNIQIMTRGPQKKCLAQAGEIEMPSGLEPNKGLG